MDRKNIGDKYLVNRGGTVEKYTVSDIYLNMTGETVVSLKSENVGIINIDLVVSVEDLNDKNRFRKVADHHKTTEEATTQTKAPLRFDPL